MFFLHRWATTHPSMPGRGPVYPSTYYPSILLLASSFTLTSSLGQTIRQMAKVKVTIFFFFLSECSRSPSLPLNSTNFTSCAGSLPFAPSRHTLTSFLPPGSQGAELCGLHQQVLLPFGFQLGMAKGSAGKRSEGGGRVRSGFLFP